MTAGSEIERALGDALTRYAGRRALVGGAETWSYAELGESIAAAARLLQQLAPGPARRHIGFRLGNGPAYVTGYFAALSAGHLPLLLDASFNTGEIAAIREDCGLDALILAASQVEELDLPGAQRPMSLGRDVAWLPLVSARPPRFTPHPTTDVCRFTSGSTGRPKCIEFSGAAVVAAARHWAVGTDLLKHDRVLCLAALSNGLAFNTSLLATFLVGGELHVPQGAPLTRRVARWIADHRITRLVAFPALYRHFATPGGPDAGALASLRHAISAGAPLWPDVREAFRSRYGLDISDYYGVAETGPCTFERDPNHHVGQGQPLPGVDLAIAPGGEDPETGEVLVRTASMATGYLNHPGMFAARLDADGFYHSGDHGRIIDGRLHLIGRTQDHINVAGRKIDPAEIVAVVSALDGVHDALAFPDEDLNRDAMVHLVVVAGRRDLTRSVVAQACRSRLAAYKVPGRISFVPEIPRNGIGKARLAALREQLTGMNSHECDER
jgi:acyl-coenzyme A synthetase/AMP-(fatty) acid ligase